jgi:hypothetical protein
MSAIFHSLILSYGFFGMVYYSKESVEAFWRRKFIIAGVKYNPVGITALWALLLGVAYSV